MYKKFQPNVIYLIFFVFQSCIVPHKSFVATSFEPLTVKQKGDLEVSASMRPFKFYKFNASIAVTNCIAIRGGYSGFFGLDNFDASVIFFKNFQKIGFFVSPSYNYQHNTINRRYSLSFYGVGKAYAYNCEYNSPSIVFGLIRFNKNNCSQQFIVKTTYNIVNKYSYYFSSDNASGKNQAFEVKDNETLKTKIPDFISFEPCYSYTEELKKKVNIRIQIGLNIWQSVLIHKYSFSNRAYSPQIKEATNLHPVSFPMNISIGFIFKHSLKKEPIVE